MGGYAVEQQAPPAAPPVKGSDDDVFLALIRQREKLAASDRLRYEPIWHVCRAFIQNRQWVGWSYRERRVLQLPKTDGRVRVTANVLTQYVQTIYSKLTAEDFRPDLTFRRDDVESVAYARQAQRAMEYGWEEEFEADEAIMAAVLKMVTFGTAGLRVYPDPTYGPLIGQAPVGPDGRLILDKAKAYEHVATLAERGEQAQLKPVREGRICLQPLSPFNILPPPGIEDEKKFPWIIFEFPCALDELVMRYGEKARLLTEEKLRPVDLVGPMDASGPEHGVGGGGQLHGHAKLKVYHELPTNDFPYGRTGVVAQDTLLHRQDRLPFVVKGMGKVGWAPIHYHRVDGRFFSMGGVEPGLGPQKERNRARSQMVEIKDRAGLGRVYAHKGVITQTNRPTAKHPFELIEILPGHELPKETQGLGPGTWLRDEVEMNDQDLEKAMGLNQPSVGGPPQGIAAFASLSLLAEQDDKRIGPVQKDMRLQLAKVTKILLAGMKEYWVPDKQISVAGDSDLLDVFLFTASNLPDDCQVKIGKGAPLPQSQAARFQLIFDLYDRSISSGQPLGIDWLFESIKLGQPAPIPKRDQAVQMQKAELENHIMLSGTLPQVAPEDNDELHAHTHGQFLVELQQIPGKEQVAMVVEMHRQQHLQSAQMKAMQAIKANPSNPGGTPPNGLQGNGRDAGFGRQIAATRSIMPGPAQ